MVPIWTTRSPMSSDWGASTVVHPAADRCGWIGRSPYLSMRVGGGLLIDEGWGREHPYNGKGQVR
jgi:hypothetical protein